MWFFNMKNMIYFAFYRRTEFKLNKQEFKNGTKHTIVENSYCKI